MNFSIPRRLVTAAEAFCDWVNVPILSGKQFDILRVDIVLVLGGIGIAGYYWFYSGWLGAIEACALYVACFALALVLRPAR